MPFIERPPTRNDRLRPGTHIEIRKFGSHWLSGYCLKTAEVYELDRDQFAWFIEFTDTADGKGYHYWKQIPDGGQLWVEPADLAPVVNNQITPTWPEMEINLEGFTEDRCPGCGEAMGFCKSLAACYEAAYGDKESYR